MFCGPEYIPRPVARGILMIDESSTVSAIIVANFFFSRPICWKYATKGTPMFVEPKTVPEMRPSTGSILGFSAQ